MELKIKKKETMDNVTFRIEEKILKWIDHYAKDNDMSRSELIRAVIVSFFESQLR